MTGSASYRFSPHRLWLRLSHHYRSVVARLFPKALRRMPIGGGRAIYAPFDHPLDLYLKKHPYYDHWLAEAAVLVCSKRPDAVVMDVGANVGDTVARLRRRGVTNPILAIEASDYYFGILARNSKAFPDQFVNVELVHAFVGNPGHSLVLQSGTGTAGTRIAEGPQAKVSTPVRRLSELTDAVTCLVKIDTDGYDANILAADISWLQDQRPVVWAETWIDSLDAVERWYRALELLSGIYERFILFDNVGVPTLWGAFASDKIEVIQRLIVYAWMQREVAAQAGGTSSIPYFDIALFCTRDRAQYEELLERVDREFKGKGAPGPVMLSR